MIYHWNHDTIDINSFTDNWGPFFFPFSPKLLPSGAVISAATVKTYAKSSGSETTSNLVKSGSTSISGNTTVLVNWQYPGSDHHGYHRVLIEVTLTNDTEKHSFNFGFLKVE